MTLTSTTSRGTTTSDDRTLREVARHVVQPSDMASTGWPAVEKRCREFGDVFDRWQAGAGRLMLAKRPNGEYAATVGGITLSLPRQVVKTFLVGRIVFALCTLFPGLKVLWTAHRGRTATQTFNKLRALASRPAVLPHMLGGSIDDAIRASNGEQEIRFANGSIIMFGAREQGFGRGFDEVDIEVFDEAQILTEKALEDMVAAANQSRFEAGALLFFMGTPPRPVDPGEVFKTRRREALEVEAARAAGDEVEYDGVYIETSADPDADPDDPAQWRKGNPSFPDRTPLRSMLRLRKNLVSVAAWLREGLGIWDREATGEGAIAPESWASTSVETAPTDGIRSYGVAFSADGMRLALAGATRTAAGVHGEQIDAYAGAVEGGLEPLANWFVEKDATGTPRWRKSASIVLSGRAGASVLAQLLFDRGVPRQLVTVATTPQYLDSCAMLDAAITSSAAAVKADLAPTFTHKASGQQQLDDSVEIVGKRARPGAGGAWGWHSITADGDETPVEALSLANWGARTSKRVPRDRGEKRKAVIL